MLSAVFNWIAYWYWRYTVVTELYMVEKWERYTIHTIFGVAFLLCGFFNYSVILAAVSKITSLSADMNHIRTISISS